MKHGIQTSDYKTEKDYSFICLNDITTNCRTMPSTNSMNSLTSDTEDDSGPVYSTVKHGRR